MTRNANRWPAAVTAALSLIVASLAADAAKGTATYKTKTKPVTVTFTHAYLMKGPQIGGPDKIRRLILSTADVSAALKACQSMMCSGGGISEGMTVDFDAGPRLHYWFVADGQKIQYSGTAALSAAKLTTDLPTQVAGTLAIDDSGAGGPSVQVQFDATLVKELQK